MTRNRAVIERSPRSSTLSKTKAKTSNNDNVAFISEPSPFCSRSNLSAQMYRQPHEPRTRCTCVEILPTGTMVGVCVKLKGTKKKLLTLLHTRRGFRPHEGGFFFGFPQKKKRNNQFFALPRLTCATRRLSFAFLLFFTKGGYKKPKNTRGLASLRWTPSGIDPNQSVSTPLRVALGLATHHRVARAYRR